MGWKDVPDEGQRAERIPGGTTDVEVTRVLHGSRKKGPFVSKSGSPQIMVIFRDRSDREAGVMVTLSNDAAWLLKIILTAQGVDLDAMDADGKCFADFSDEAFAAAQLLNRPWFRAEVRWNKGKGTDAEFAEVIPLRQSPATPPIASVDPLAPSTDDIPV